MYNIERDSIRLLMMVGNGDVMQYDKLKAMNVVEFFGIVWDFEKRIREQNERVKKKYDGKRDRPEVQKRSEHTGK